MFYRIFYKGKDMRSILEKMYYGEKFGGERISFSAEEQEVLNKKLACDRAFAEKLPPDLAETFRCYADDIGDLYEVDIKHAYVEGVKIGILIGLEASEALGGD